MRFLTDFADQAVILPLALAVALLLAMRRWWRGALAWALCVGFVLATVGLGKFLLAACGPVALGDVLRSPSGHTASAAIVYGGLPVLLWRRTALWPALVITAGIGLSRVALGAHTWPEVVLGGAVGLLGAWALPRLAGPPPAMRLPWLPVALGFVLVAWLHGAHLRAEPVIRDWGRQFAWLLPGCAVQARP